MILDYPFKFGINEADIPINIDLNRLRKYNKIAETDAHMMESIDEDPTFCKDVFKMSFTVKDRISLSNFKQQISKLKKLEIDEVHINNLIFLTVNIIKFEELVFRDHSNIFSDIRNDIVSMLDIANAIHDGKVSEVKMSLYSDVKQLGGINFKIDVVSNLLLPILAQGIVRFKKYYNPLFKKVIGKTYDLKNLTNLDLQSIVADIDDYISANTDRGFKRYHLDLLLLYIRENDVFPTTKYFAHTTPRSIEARLIYFILCITGSRKVMLDPPQLVKPKEEKLNDQNDMIINQIKGEYIKSKSPIASIAKDDDKIFEYYCASLLK